MKRLVVSVIASLLLATPCWAQGQTNSAKKSDAGKWFTVAGISLLIAGAGIAIAYGSGCNEITGSDRCKFGEAAVFRTGAIVFGTGAVTAVLSALGGLSALFVDAPTDKERSVGRVRRWAVTPQVTPRGDVALGLSWLF